MKAAEKFPKSSPSPRAAPTDDRLLALLRAAVKTGEFTLASGRPSDWYLDCREVTLTPEGSLLCAKKLIRAMLLDGVVLPPLPSVLEPTAVVGPIVAACPLVTGVGIQAAGIGWHDLKLGYVRKEAKKHGTGRLIEGCELDCLDWVTVVDDVATSGGSLLRAIEAVWATGAKILEAVVLVDREEGAKEAIAAWCKENGVPPFKLRAFYTKADLVEKS